MNLWGKTNAFDSTFNSFQNVQLFSQLFGVRMELNDVTEASIHFFVIYIWCLGAIQSGKILCNILQDADDEITWSNQKRNDQIQM